MRHQIGRALRALAERIDPLPAARTPWEQEVDLMRQIVENQRRVKTLHERQGQEILDAVIAAVNGGIGGRVGLGFQSPGGDDDGGAGTPARYK